MNTSQPSPALKEIGNYILKLGAMLSEEEAPEWGSVEERGIDMEIATAVACLTSGSDVVIMKHPAAIKTVAQFIDSLM